jgi:glucan biosynthesis protein C
MRALLMLLGIPYHVAMVYRADDVWIMRSSEGAAVFNHLAQAIHAFRMPAFFIIAGYFAALLLARRSPGAWLEARVTRLGIPLLAALLTLNPLLNLLGELTNYSWAAALVSWRENSATSGGYWVRHLWFLIILLYFSATAALLCRWVPRLSLATLPARLDHKLAHNLFLVVLATATAVGLWEAVAIELFYSNGLATNLIQQILRVDQAIEFAPYFLIGCIIARAPALKSALYRFSPTVALFAIAALGVDLVFRDALWAPMGRFLDTLAAVAVTQLLIATIKRIADRPNPLVQETVKASFVIYLFHMPILAALVIAGQQVAMPIGLKVPLIMAVTLALSCGVWWIVRRSPLLRLLYDGQRAPRSPQFTTPSFGR